MNDEKERTQPARLFTVHTSIEVDMVVLAESEEQAKKIGLESWLDEVRDASLEPDYVSATEVRHARDVAWFGEENLSCCPPRGPYEDPPQLSIDEYLRQQKIPGAPEKEDSNVR